LPLTAGKKSFGETDMNQYGSHQNNENRSLYDGLPPQGFIKGTAGREFFIFILWRKPFFRDKRQNIY